MLGRPWFHVEWAPTPRDDTVTCGMCQHQEETELVGETSFPVSGMRCETLPSCRLLLSRRMRDAVTRDASRRHLHSRALL